ncbi:hypothetical protein [Schaalia hyovaginalis]|uniref:Uncharacterized protein n=1 Tax=Schaalia hyovaginalis TaxID=29316 RepID=A0A923IYM4_9ACTO|nr:hypothetical protein [Schaalia hyovaginalis]MBB6335663.1 hypothetical protein [Schaalia hyovaginalis]
METTTLAKENTTRLLHRAAALGYRIDCINPHGACPITCTPVAECTPAVSYTPETGWVCHTASNEQVTVSELERIAEGYQRAAALITAFEAATDLAPYTRP